ncbi:hypothetical protein DE146DRAFT_189439 [Phaeosphaeria sp. MPI-PUGE-AT-0046c]|nr:hypothetical protein DE146DRAFT_189439 [Phaeosphaeria sp. MPI-PUGE-AT-0046c]
MEKPFQDKVVLVTGGASGIGRATAIKMASLGASIALCDLNLSGLETVASQLPTPSLAHQVDVSSTAQVDAFVAATLSKFARIDHIFNCAGVNPTATRLEDTPDAYWDKLVNTNLKGVFLVTRACAPHLARGGSIVNVSSISGQRGAALQSVYCATKFGLIGFSKALAQELGPRGIRVNCVAPGYIDTPSNAGMLKGGEVVERMRMGNALERLGEPEEVADVVAFLMGEGARYVNGSVVEVDGGIKMSSTTSSGK